MQVENVSYEESRVDVAGVDVAVLSAGEGDPVVFFHGAGTATGFDVLLPIAANHRLIIPIHPGFGTSGGPACESIEQLAEHKLALLDTLGVDRFSLVGHSMGGWTAAVLARRAPERVKRLVLAAPAGLASKANPTVNLLDIPDDEVLSYLAADMSIFGPADAPPPPADFIAERVREGESWAVIAGSDTGPFDTSLLDWLPSVATKSLVLWGERDRIVAVGQAAEFAAAMPNATATTFDDVGHLMFDEHAPAVQAIVDFIRS